MRKMRLHPDTEFSIFTWACGIGLVACLVALGWVVYTEVTEAKSGTITGKDFTSAYSSVSCSGKPSVCSSTWIPECYRVEYKNDSGKTGNACVTALEYDRYRIGDHYPVDISTGAR